VTGEAQSVWISCEISSSHSCCNPLFSAGLE